MSTSPKFFALGLVLAGTLSGPIALAADSPGASRLPRLPSILAQVTPAATAASGRATDGLRSVERQFIVQGLEQSRDEAELSRLALSQASRSDLRDFAQQLISDYREINGSLETLARRKTVDVPIQPVSFSDRYRELATRSGTAFDQAFIREIAAANTRTLRLCEAAVANAKDGDIRELAGNLLPVVREHVNRTTDLQKSL